MTILVVDDDSALLELLADFLCRHGYHLETAVGGVDALRQMANRTPHLVISDIEMPGMNGLALLNAIQVRHPQVPVIMMTGGDPGLLSIALRNGAHACLMKPFKLQAVLESVERIQREKDAYRGQDWFLGFRPLRR